MERVATPENQKSLYDPPPYCVEEVAPKELIVDSHPTPPLVVSSPGKILNLISSLTNNSTKLLEYKINLYLKDESDAKRVFMINLLSVSEEAVVQVNTDKILESPRRTPLTEDEINNLVEYKDDTLKCAEVLEPKIQGLLQEVLSDDHHNDIFLVPIISKGRKRHTCFFIPEIDNRI